VNPVLLDWNWDDLYTADPSRFVSWQGTRYQALSELQAVTGQELQGLTVDPGFRNLAGGDLTLSTGSALIDRGVLIPGINEGFSGPAPDIGAFENSPDAGRPSAPTGVRILGK